MQTLKKEIDFPDNLGKYLLVVILDVPIARENFTNQFEHHLYMLDNNKDGLYITQEILLHTDSPFLNPLILDKRTIDAKEYSLEKLGRLIKYFIEGFKDKIEGDKKEKELLEIQTKERIEFLLSENFELI